MKIALLVPSRERIELKTKLAQSIKDTADSTDNFVLYYGIDDDDPTREEANKLAEQFPFIKIIELHNDGKFPGVGKLWNDMTRETDEEIIAMIGDDMEFRTQGWDTKILEEFNGKNLPEDKIKLVYCYDGRHGSRIAVNLFIHRRYVEITGYFMREEFKCDFVDLWLHQVFNAFGRAKYRRDIHIEHKHWSFRKSPKDSVVQRLRGGDNVAVSRRLWKDLEEERIKEVGTLATKIDVVPNMHKINSLIVG